jgi:hypothetical protein
VVKLEFTVEKSSSRKYTNIINVLDLMTGKQTLYDDLRNELKATADNLKQLVQQRLKALELSYTTASTVMNQYQTWKETKVDSVSYTISGPALGYSGTKLAPGMWTYNSTANTITPNDTGSSNLEKIIMGR